MLAPRYANQKQGGSASLQVRRQEDRGDAPLFVPLRSTHCSGSVTGPLARLKLTQTFRYAAEDCPGPLEAVYRFPLPGDALVTNATVTFGECRIETELAERKEAAEGYAKARHEGRQGLLLDQSGADAFTLLLTGLEPDTDIVVEISFLLYAAPSDRGWTLRLPLTTAPRYHRGDETERPVFGSDPLALAHDPGHRFSLDLIFPQETEVTSPSTALERQNTSEGTRIGLADGETVPDRDLVLHWSRPEADESPLLNVTVQPSGDSKTAAFLAAVTPPADLGGKEPAHRELILLVDYSGSMEGAKKRAADWAVRNLLDTLTPDDRFALGAFGSFTEWHSRELSAGTPDQIAAANRFLGTTRAGGGTELGVALEQAVSFPVRDEGVTARHIVILTDAQVSDGARLLHLAGKARQEQRRRVSVLCIDSAPNEPLAEAIASEGEGHCVFLSSDPDQSDLTTALEGFLSLFNPPVSSGLRLRAEGLVLEQPDGTRGSQVPLDFLLPGRTAVILGRIDSADRLPAFTLVDAEGNVLASCNVTLSGDRTGLNELFAARRIRRLELIREMAGQGLDVAPRLKQLGLKAPGGLLYLENCRDAADALLKKHILALSLAAGIPSSETSLLAVGEKHGERVRATCIVPQAAPHGWEMGHHFCLSGRGSMRCMMAPPTFHSGSGFENLPSDISLSLDLPDPAYLPTGPDPACALPDDLRFEADGGPDALTLYDGTLDPATDNRELFTGTLEDLQAPKGNRLIATELSLESGGLAALKQWAGLTLVLETDGEPTLTVSLPELARRSGKRPLNLLLEPGARLRLELRGQSPSGLTPVTVRILLHTGRF